MIHRTTARLSLLFVAACAGAPSPIERELAKTPEGQVTIVEFVDYRCTHCQTMFDVLAPLLDRNEGRVRVVVKHVPSRSTRGLERPRRSPSAPRIKASWSPSTRR
jgi:hypothetical protein